MQDVTFEIGKSFKIENFKKSFKLTWLYVGIGLFVFILFSLLTMAVPQQSFFYYFIQNIGSFLLFTALLMAYSGVYRITKYPEGSLKVTRTSIKMTAKRFHYILGFSLATIVFLILVVFIEVGISALSYIPYAGPALMGILTIPFFLVNLFCILLAICIFAVVPPLVGEAETAKDLLTELKVVIQEKWLNVIIYLIFSLSVLILSLLIIFYLLKHAIGITKALQWKISAAYPDIARALISESYFTDLINRITPRPEAAANLKAYSSLFDFVSLLRYLITVSYLAVFSFIISFPLAAYFNLSSFFFKSIWTKEQKSGD